jgi:hypothetical protein
MKNWTESDWCGRTNYECADCAYSTLEVDAIVRHSIRSHGARPQVAEGVGVLRDYTIKHTRGGYYTVAAPDGTEVPGPSNGKWQGKDGAVQGALAHASAQNPTMPTLEEEED